MNRRYKAFTVELLTVMGIIVLFIALAIPAVVPSRVRAAPALPATKWRLWSPAPGSRRRFQGIRGVLFYVDPVSDRVVGLIVQQAATQD